MQRKSFFLGLLLAGCATFSAGILSAQEPPPLRPTPRSAPTEKDQAEQQAFVQLVLKGVKAEDADDYQSAYDYYSLALLKEPESVVALVRRIFCSAKLNQRSAMLADLQTVLAVQPQTMADYLSLAWLRGTSPMEAVRDASLTIAYAQKAMIDRKSPEAFDCLAAGYVQMGNFDRAVLELERALKLFPDSKRAEKIRERLALYREGKVYLEDWSPTVPLPES